MCTVETALLLAELGEQESKKDQALTTNMQLSNAQEQVGDNKLYQNEHVYFITSTFTCISMAL